MNSTNGKGLFSADFKKQISKILLRLPAIFVMCVSWYLSSQERLDMPDFQNSDKLVHFVCFGFLAFCWTFWFANESWKIKNKRSVLLRNILFRQIIIVVAIVSIYGIIDEIHQSFVPGRFCSVFDWIADTMGALMGCGIRILLGKNS